MQKMLFIILQKEFPIKFNPYFLLHYFEILEMIE